MNNTEKLIVPDRRLSKAMKLVLIALSTVLLGCNLWASMTNHQGPVELNIASTLYLAGLAYIWLKSTPFEASEVESLRFQIQGIWVKLRSGSKRLYLSEFVDLTSLREQLEERVLPRLENDLTRSLEVGERYRCKPERKHLILVLFILSVLIAQVSFADALIPLAAIVLLRVWEKRSRRVDFIDRDGVTLTDAEHMMATRLWQNTAKVHFNTESRPDGKRLVYGGHIISLARALSFNGLANAQLVAAINAGAHTAPAFAGDTVYAFSEVLDRAETANPTVGALRLRLVATKGRDESMTLRGDDGKYAPGVLLDLDLWALVPR